VRLCVEGQILNCIRTLDKSTDLWCLSINNFHSHYARRLLPGCEGGLEVKGDISYALLLPLSK